MNLPFALTKTQSILYKLIIFSLLTVTFFGNVIAAEAQGTGVSIRPATNGGVSLDPGVDEKYQITVENLSSEEQTFYLFSRNISGSQAGGVPIFARDNNEKTGMELSDWITLSTTEITIPGSNSAAFEYTLNVPENASPGTHLGAIFVSVEPPNIENSGAAVGYQVAHIVDVRVSGDIVEEGNVRQFSTSKYLYGSSKVEFLVRIENTGNVLIKPRGPLEVKNMLGNKVATLVFNETESAVLPKETKEYSNIVWEGQSTGFGRYEAVISPIYGGDGVRKTMSSTVTFWILPMNIIGPALGVLAFILIITFIIVRLYIKRSIQHLNHERRMIKRKRRGGPSTTLLLSIVMLTVTALFLIVLLALFA